METIESRIRRAVNSIRKFQNNFLLPQTLSGFTALKCQEPFPSKRKLHNYHVSISCSIFCGYILHIYIYIYIYRVIQNVCRGTIVQRKFRTEFGKQPPSDNSIRKCYGQFQETERERVCVCVCVCVCISRNWRYESEPPLKPSPLTCYRQFGTNLIIVLMVVESQTVYI